MSAGSEDYRTVLGKEDGMQRGITTGTCAQAASLASSKMLVSGKKIEEVSIHLKDGRQLTIPIVNPVFDSDYAECGVIKDAGDDEEDDVTHGAEIRARVWVSDEPGIHIDGGKGVGRATRKGLPVSPGSAAINPNPRKQIVRELLPLVPPERGFHVLISVPKGEELAEKTWNPRLGIEGGISIIGTTGVVEPRSLTSFKASIILSLEVIRQSGHDTAALAFGYVGENWYRLNRGWGEDRVVKFGDHVGTALDSASSRGFSRLILAGHPGKMSKVAAGLFDTHWKAGDARMETVAAWAGAAGADTNTIQELLRLKTTEAAVSCLAGRNLSYTWELMNRRLLERCRIRLSQGRHHPVLESILIDMEGRVLAHGEI